MERNQALGTVAMVLGLAAHLVVGFFYLAAGLVVPGPWLFVLWAVWLLLLVLAIRRRQRPPWVLAIPVAAVVLLLVAVSLGERWLGWQA